MLSVHYTRILLRLGWVVCASSIHFHFAGKTMAGDVETSALLQFSKTQWRAQA